MSNKFKSMTMKQKAQTRAHMKAAGLDPMKDFSAAEFVQYAKLHGFLDDNAEGGNAKLAPGDAHEQPENDGNDDDEQMIPDDEDFVEDNGDAGNGADEGEAEGDDGDVGQGDEEDDGEDEAEDMGDDEAEGEDEQEDAPEPPAADNAVEQLIDERIAAHLAHHVAADQHKLSATETKRLIAKIRKDMKAAGAGQPVKHDVVKRKFKQVELGNTHEKFDTCKRILALGLNLYMKGEAGSGKTTMGKQLAEVMDLPFYMIGRVDDIFMLTGYKNVQGEYEETDFYKAFANGGVFLADEGDRWAAEALTGINSASANGYMAFPGKGLVQAHKDFVLIMAGNTWGTGHDRVYTAAQALDGATMDRYVKVEIEYDEKLERDVALAYNNKASKWADYVQKVRANKEKAKMDMIISPRASIIGAQLLADGFTVKEVKEMLIYPGLNKSDIATLENGA